jgi:sugar phosphate isomerase/epimerase
MRFAICNELFDGWSLEETCAYVSSLGYSGIELAPFTLARHPKELTKSARLQIAKVIANHGLSNVGLHWLLAKTEGLHLTNSDLATRQRTFDYLQLLVELCHDLGGGVMVLGSPQQRSIAPESDHAAAPQRAQELLSRLAATLESAEVVLALEPLGPEETNFWNTAAETIEFIEALNCPNIRLHLDVKAMSTEQRSFREIITSSSRHLSHFHANDPNRQGPGMGSVDYAEIVQALHDVHYEGWVSVEVFDYSPGIDALAQRSISYLKTMFGRSP